MKRSEKIFSLQIDISKMVDDDCIEIDKEDVKDKNPRYSWANFKRAMHERRDTQRYMSKALLLELMNYGQGKATSNGHCHTYSAANVKNLFSS